MQNKKVKGINLLFQVLLFILIPLASSCSEGDFSIGDDFVTSDTYTAITDTFSLNLSTFRMDSVETSGTGLALCGYSQTHETSSTAFFRIGVPSSMVDDKEQFDSLCLVMNHSGYYLGDTTKLFGLDIHLLDEEITTNESGTICNDDWFNYSPIPVGSSRYYPEPNEESELSIRLSDDLGKMLLDTLQADSYMTSSDFKDIIKGIALAPDTEVSDAIMGYNASEDDINIRLYSHVINLEKTEITHDFPLTSTSYQFNHIESISDEPLLRGLTSYKQTVSETQLDHSAVLQGGTGFFTRIDIEGLSSMKALENKGRIVKANLLIGVHKEQNQTQNPPSSLFLLEADNINQLSSYIVDSSGSTVTGTLTQATSLYEETWVYSFDITYFLNALINEEVISDGTGIVVALSEDDLKGSVTKLKFKGYTDASAETRLNVFYYNYDKE